MDQGLWDAISIAEAHDRKQVCCSLPFMQNVLKRDLP